MNKKEFSDLLKHKAAIVKDRERYESAFKEISKYVIPHREDWEWAEKDSSVRPKIYDSTAVKANQDLADGYQGYMVSPRSPWFKIGMQDPKEDKDEKLQRWREEHAEPGLFRLFSRSNFYSAIGQTLQDNALGTAVLYIEKDDETVINFIPQHLKGIYIAEDSHDRIDTVFHKMLLPNRTILSKYSENLPGAEKSRMEENPYGRTLVWRSVQRNGNMKEGAIGPKGMPWKSTTFLDGLPEKPLKESGYKKFPYIVWRPIKCTGEAYGRSPAWFALGDILRLNQLEKSMLELSLLSVKPPLNVPSELLDSVNVTPWGMNPYTTPERQIFPLNLGQNYPFGAEEREQLRESIRGYFMVEAFKLLTTFADKEYSATQAAELAGEKSTMLTALTARTGSELLDPIIGVSLQYGIDAGVIEPPPMEIRGGIKVDYIGPLTSDQERAFRTSGIIRGLNSVAPFFEAFPEIVDIIKNDPMFREMLEASGVTKKYLNSKAEVENIRTGRAEAQAQAQQVEQAKSQAQAYKDTTWAPQKGSAAEKLNA